MQEFHHQPVMLAEVLAALRPGASGVYADGTLGGAGHARAILEASSPTGWLFGCDRDGAAIETAGERLADFAGRFELRRGSFSELVNWVPRESCDGVLLDLGVSSHQLDTGERGFSFLRNGPLDMRMDTRQALTAASLVNEADEGELSRIFWTFGGEREARRFARRIVAERQVRKFESTMQLAEFIERLAPRHGRKAHPATKLFQGLRIAVNNELGVLQESLPGLLSLLKPGGRLAVITFHSAEDRIVKDFTRSRARDYTFEGPVDVPELRRSRIPEVRLVSRKPILPSERELAENPRSRSAQLRVVEKI